MLKLTNAKVRIEKFQFLEQKEKPLEYSAITSDLKSAAVNLKMWQEKLAYYQSRDNNCSDFSNLLELANSLSPMVDDHLANLNRLSIENPKSFAIL
jgi:hypothetical protein